MLEKEHPMDTTYDSETPTATAADFTEADWNALTPQPDPDHPGTHVREVILTETTHGGLTLRIHLVQSTKFGAPVIATVLPPTGTMYATDPWLLARVFEHVATLLRQIDAVPPPTMPVSDFDADAWWKVPVHHDADEPAAWSRSVDLVVDHDLEPTVTIRLTSTSRNSVPTMHIMSSDTDLFPAETRALVPALAHVNEVIDEVVHRPRETEDEQDLT